MAESEKQRGLSLNGLCAELHRLGLHFSISGELQSHQLTLDLFVWTVKRSKSEMIYMISLFWSFRSSGDPSRKNIKKKNKKKKKKVIASDPESQQSDKRNGTMDKSVHL